MSRATNISLVAVFAAVLLAPTAAHLLHFNPMGTIDEKRVLAERPKQSPWSWSGLQRASAIAQDWEKYFNDHVGLRKLMIGGYRLITYKVLRTSPNPSVLLGESDGQQRWLYFDPSVIKDGIGFESSLGLVPYRPPQLQSIAAQLTSLTALVRARGIRLAIVVCPDKHTIYPEYLPSGLRPAPGTLSRLDQFWSMAGGLEGIPLIDMRGPLRQAKSSTLLYYPSDTHWNWRAGLLAYQAIAKVLSAQDPAHPLASLDDLQWWLAPPRLGDLVMLMGIPSFGGDVDWAPRLIDAASKQGKVLVVGDSFSEVIKPFLQTQFAQMKFVLSSTTRTAITASLLDAEKPDAVVVEALERYWTM